GYVKIDSVISQGSIPARGDSTKQRAIFTSKQFVTRLSNNPINHSELFLGGYWCYKWYDEFIRVRSVDTVSNEIQLAAPHRYGIGGPSGGLFFAINLPEELDLPGEYYYNHETGTLRFLLPHNTGADPAIEIAYQDFTMIEMNNCKNIHFESINFVGNNGFAASLQDCDSVSFQNCDFTDFAQSVVSIKGGSYCGLDSCEISQVGATGVILDGGDRMSLHPAGHYVKNSYIHHFARHVKTYAPAVNLHGVGHYVGHNYIHDAPHNAILFHGNDHLIEYNKIERVCWDTSDAGAIYCGRDWTMGGTVIQYNSFSNLGKASHHHNWAIYLDDLASGIDVLYNDIEDCPSGILVGGGRYNRVIGNKIVNCERASIMYDARGLGWYQQYINDPDNTLWTRLAEMPVDKAPWSERFPWLQDIANDDPAVPKHAVIIDNEIINSKYPDIHPTVFKYGNVVIR
ncbi:MAG: right-handed parallel beta-helix repeat-containing protein, partial [Bacteroidales bacterium]|nr:right-handed parallel beta-helix repeat-containing protein [Bacteroidales bacterium]